MVNGRAAASGAKRIDLSEEIAWFGDILNIDDPLVEIGLRLALSIRLSVSGSSCQATPKLGSPALSVIQGHHLARRSSFSRGFSVLLGRRRTVFIESAGEPDFPLDPSLIRKPGVGSPFLPEKMN